MRGCSGEHDRAAGRSAGDAAPDAGAALAAHPVGRAHRPELRARPALGGRDLVHDDLLDTDDYVNTVTPLAENEEILEAVSVRVTNTLFENVDVEELGRGGPAAADRVPRRSADRRAARLRPATRSLASSKSEHFQTLWDEANRLAHVQVDKALTGGGERRRDGGGQGRPRPRRRSSTVCAPSSTTVASPSSTTCRSARAAAVRALRRRGLGERAGRRAPARHAAVGVADPRARLRRARRAPRRQPAARR